MNNFLAQLIDLKGRLSSQRIKKLSQSTKNELFTMNPTLDSTSVPEHLYWIVNKLIDYPVKCYCGKPITKFNSFSKGYTQKYCSKHCARNDPMEHLKKKKTIKKRYGVDSIWKVQSIVKKREKTCQKRYGASHSMQLALNALHDKYQVEHVSKIPSVLKNRLETIRKREALSLEKRLEHRFALTEDYVDSTSPISYTCVRCNTINKAKPAKISCAICDRDEARSSIETLLLSELRKNYKGVCLQNKKHPTLSVFPDLFFPRENLVVEIDGNYWHSELRGGDKLKSFKKKKLYQEANINSLFFFEDECINQLNIVVSMILLKLGCCNRKLRASACEVREIETSIARDFLNAYHLQGTAPAKIKLGLFHESELLGVLTIGKSRFNRTVSNELIRLCFKTNVRVHGGVSKLLKIALTMIDGPLLTYSDNRFSDGKVYKALGFKLISSNHPAYFYLKRTNYITRISRIKMQKKRLLEMGGQPELTEWENAILLGYDRIFDCGTKTWVLTI